MSVHQLITPKHIIPEMYHLLIVTMCGEVIEGIEIDGDLARDLLDLIAARKAGEALGI